LHTKVGERRERERERERKKERKKEGSKERKKERRKEGKKERTHGIAVFNIFLQKFAEISFSFPLFRVYKS
jgi:hypothetical protein